MGVEDTLGVAVEQSLAGMQPLRSLLRQRCTIKIELPDLLQPALELLQVGVLFLEFGVGKFVDRDLLGDLGLEIGAASEKLAILVVAIRLEAGDDLVLLHAVKRDRFQDDAFAAHFGDIVLDHLQPTDVIVGLRQQADTILEIDRAHTFKAAPKRNALGSRLGRHLVGQQKPG